MKRTHGLSKTRLYKRWKGIKYRCYGKHCSKYYMYGARGIMMCDEWKNDFMTFYKWSMENGFKPELTIDRIDYNGNYCPENCRWVDVYAQANNKSNIKRYNIDNQNLTLTEVSQKYNVNFETLSNRVLNLKWDLYKAINTPVEIGRNQFTEINNTKNINLDGELISFNELCEISGLSNKIVRRRLNKGWTASEIINTPERHHKNTKKENI